MDEALAILGLQRGATHDQIHAAYRTAAKRTHPDKGGKQEEFVRLQHAYERLLSDSESFYTPLTQHSDTAHYASRASEQNATADDRQQQVRNQFQRESVRFERKKTKTSQRQGGTTSFTAKGLCWALVLTTIAAARMATILTVAPWGTSFVVSFAMFAGIGTAIAQMGGPISNQSLTVYNGFSLLMILLLSLLMM